MAIKAVPQVVANVEAYKPVLDLCRDVWLTPAELAERYRYTEEHLCNLRKAGRGWPFLKLDTGGIRYRLSDILAAEIRGTCGPLTLERVLLALAACPDLSAEDKASAQNHLRKAFG